VTRPDFAPSTDQLWGAVHSDDILTVVHLIAAMHVLHLATLFPLFVHARPTEPPHRIPTMRESAVMGRRILHLSRIGTMSTVFPKQSSSKRYPSSVAGTSLSLMEYFADCEPSTGNPTLLSLSVSSNVKNAREGSNVTLSVRWEPETQPHSAVALPRMSLTGYLARIRPDEDESAVKACYGKAHPDSVPWMPGGRIHESFWTRLVVKDIFWVGGFGDRAFIGWIPEHVWKNVTVDEIEQCRLPGEGASFLERNIPRLEM
jgi:hypothetical protein